MASQLKVDTLTGVTTAGSIDVTGEGNSTTTNLQQGLCKAWCHLDLNTENTIDDSFNNSSITDSSTGRFLVTNSSAMASISYIITASAWNGNNDEYGRMISPALARTTTIAKLAGTDSTNRTLQDYQDVDVMTHGDLA